VVDRWVADSTLSERFPIYTRANVGEVFPDPVTPLTFGSALWLAEVGWRDAWARIGAFSPDEFKPDEFEVLGVVGGYCYLNASQIRLFGERAPGLSWQMMDAQVFGAQPGIPPYEEHPGDVRPDLTAKIGETLGWVLSLGSVDELTELTEDRVLTEEIRAARPDLSVLDDHELLNRYSDLMPIHRTLFAHHIFTTFLVTVPVGIISAVCTAIGKPEAIMTLLAGVGDIDSAEPSLALWDLGRMVAHSATLSAAFGRGVDGVLDFIREAGGAESLAFLEAFERFTYTFGSRGPNEWEARSPTWETQPELALAAIERMRLSPDSPSPSSHHAQLAAARETLGAQLTDELAGDPVTQAQFAAALRSSRAWLPGRERTKTNNIRLIHECRMTLRELGARMVERGAFDEIEDFGFVLWEETDDLLVDPHKFTGEIRRRRAQYHHLAELEPPFVFAGEPPAPSTWTRRDAIRPDRLKKGDVVQGVPGCPGVATGKARVVLDSHNPAALEPGDVLVAPITDPSWTPLFVPAAGVVVDVGAPLSHAVIVSRELGIPCVVSVTGATQVIPDGALVRVDGNAGTVTVLELPN
jgi:phosphohistidine swiveling domain-containing protein